MNAGPSPQPLTAKAALVAIRKLQARLDAMEGARTEPIAIVGIGCRFPGGADTPDALWRLLCEGVDAVTEVPPERWDVDEYYDPDPAAKGKMVTRWGSFLEGVDRFDPQFFGLSPREAASMDPQQRLLLEVAWEALEDAALAPERLGGSRTGVFVGIYNNDYAQLQLRSLDTDAHEALGSALGIAAGRLSYLFDFQGPSLLVDTLCSSSAVAVHLASQSLRSGDCDLALAGGVNLTLSPFSTITTSRLLALSPDGRCRTFDARANGYVRGEGCGLVVLKRLADAQRDGDPIWALLRGSAVNQDGRSTALTAPNVRSQQAVIRRALANAGVQPDAVGYVEAHGTGTSLGDPIEVDALRAVYGRPRAAGRLCALGSVKTNLGHLEAAAGIAGLLKAVLAVRYGAIPPHLHFRRLNPRISLTGTPFVIPTARTEWSTAERVAGVSSFGLSGTNAHLIVSEPPEPAAASNADGPSLLTLSARTDTALRALAERYRSFFATGRAPSLADVCFTTQTGRSHFAHRLAVTADTAEDAAARLAAFAEGPPSLAAGAPPKLAFLFTGQGAQYSGMGRGLYASVPRFRAAIDECAAIAHSLVDIPLAALLFEGAGDGSINRTSYTQVALFALEWSLAQLWMSWGVRPDFVLGHSFGEYVAACLAGAFSVDDGLKLVAARGRLMQSVSRAGAMATIFAGEDDVRAALAPYGGELSVAAVNAPARIVISGPRDLIDTVCAAYNARQVETRLLAISQASHSALMDPILDEFERVASAVAARPLTMPLVSNRTGDVMPAGTVLDAGYWRTHLRQPVLLSRSIQTLSSCGCGAYLEIGPHPTLTSLGPQTLPDAPAVWVPSLRQGADDHRTVLDALGQLYVAGCNPDWPQLHGEARRRLPALPTYPFERARFWTGTAHSAATAGMPTGDPLLGNRLNTALPQVLFESRLSLDAVPWLDEHRVQGAAVLPAAAVLAMARGAAARISPDGWAVADLVIRQPLLVPDHGMETTQFVVSPFEEGRASFQLHSLDGERWRVHAEGTFARHIASAAEPLEAVRTRCAEDVHVGSFYDGLAELGLEYGPLFRGLSSIARDRMEAVARFDRVALDVALLDACFQLLAVPFADEPDLYLPLSVERAVWQSAMPQSGWVHARARAAKPGSEVRTGDITLYDSDGRVVLTVEGLALGRLRRGVTEAAPALRRWLRVLDWRAREVPPLPPRLGEPGRWILFADPSGCAQQIASLLGRLGNEAEVVDPSTDPRTLDLRCTAVVYLSGLDGSLEANVGTPLRLVQAVVTQGGTPRMYWVTCGAAGPAGIRAPHQAALWGFASVVAREHPELPHICFDLDPGLPPQGSAAAFLASALDGDDVEVRRALRGGRLYTPGLVAPPTTEADSGPVCIEASPSGELQRMRLAPLERRAPAAGEIEVHVDAAGLNFRDVLKALALFPGDPTRPGFECAGRVVAVGDGVPDIRVGDRVVTLAPECLATHVTVSSALAARIPEGISTLEAATLPVVFLTARFALTECARLAAGERVLVHSATGGVGLAAIQWAKRLGARVYATVGSDQKRAVLEGMGVPVVGSSRALPSLEDLRRAIGGDVDVVLNALSGDAIDRSLRLLAPHGRFVELGRRGIWSPDQVAAVRPDVAYHIVELPEVAAREPALAGRWLREVVEMVGAGQLQPLPVQAFPLSTAAQAFRLMAQGQHIGKVGIDLRSPPQAIRIDPDGHYLITGGRGGVGLALAQWLVEQGARHLILASRQAPDAAQQETIGALRAAGAEVTTIEADVADTDALRSKLPPLRGVIHAAAVLDDGAVIQQTWERAQRVLSPKIAGAWALHQVCEQQSLDFFVLCSSAASLLGSPGQAPYAAANAVLDALAAWRRERGLSAVSINWGPVATVGRAAEVAPRVRAQWAAAGIALLPPAALGAAMLAANETGASQVLVLAADWKALRAGSADPLFAAQPAVASAAASPPVRSDLSVPDVVRRSAARVLGLSSEADLPNDQPLRELGLDSLLAVELRNVLARELGRSLPATLAFDYPTIDAIVTYVSDRTDASPVPAPTRDSSPTASVAIIGMGCRFPGGADTPEQLWQLLATGGDGIREVPRERWDVDAYYDPRPGIPGKMSTRWAGVVDGIDRFDAAFFGISPREAASMDPQHRLLLEVTWEALESAGVAPDRLSGSLTGVFVGISTADYSWLQMRTADPHATDVYAGTGNAVSVAAGRLAYVLGLQGPCMALDTACSSSLTAVHLACQSLRSGECDLAIAGGVNAILTPDALINFSQARMMASDGRCKTFDAAADGFVRGEGCGMLVLKRTSDALRDGDPIVAVIRGSAVNQDGRSNGLTAPNGPSQVAVIRAALARAGVAPGEIGYIEAHGTGTALGDPIEVQAIGAVVSTHPREQPLIVGSIKSNVGHLEAAAGVAGLIKSALSLQRGLIPPNLHFRSPNPHIPWDSLPVTVPTVLTPWPAAYSRRIAGISGFGISGTNAHVVLEEAPAPPEGQTGPERPLHVLALSAKSSAALRALAVRYGQHLQARGSDTLADVCHTANTGRSHFAHRLAIVAPSAEEACRQLAGAATTVAGAPPKIAFLFTGQGSQYAGMGRELYERQPAFRAALHRCADVLAPLMDVGLIDLLYGGATDLLAQTRYTQPALVALECSLAELWESWGIVPDAVLGHSVGECAAACHAGVLGIDDALRLAAARGRLMEQTGGGAMTTVFADATTVARALEPFAGRAAISAFNGRAETVVAGEADAIGELEARLLAAGTKWRRMSMAYAFHSPAVGPVVDMLEQEASALSFHQGRMAVVSSLTGQFASHDLLATAGYWRDQARQPVQFAEAFDAIRRAGHTVVIEIGPSPTLLGIAQRDGDADGATWLPTLRKGRSDWEQILDSLASAYRAGARVDWHGFDRDYSRRRVALPTYPFERQRHWITTTRPETTAARVATDPGLGRRLSSPALAAVVYESLVSTVSTHALKEHRVHGAAVMPAASYLAHAVAAARDALAIERPVLEEFAFHAPLVVGEEESRSVQIVVGTSEGSARSFEVHSRDAAAPAARPWTLHASATIHSPDGQSIAAPSATAIRERCPEIIAGADVYEHARARRIDLGPSFQVVDRIWRGAGEVLARLTLPMDANDQVPLGAIDACFQLLAAASSIDRDVTPVPVSCRRVSIHGALTGELWATARLDGDALIGDALVFDEDRVLLEMAGVHLQHASADLVTAVPARGAGSLYEIAWQASPMIPDPGPAGMSRWLLVGDRQGVAEALRPLLEAGGAQCAVVSPDEVAARDWAAGTGVVFLSGLDATLPAEAGPICLTALRLVQAAAAAATPPSIWFVTSGALSGRHPVQATLWGLGRTVRVEQPELWGGVVDLDPEMPSTSKAAAVLGEIAASDREREVLYRDGIRHVSRLRRRAAVEHLPFGLDRDGTYVITGGRGALGLHVARRMAERGAGCLVLLARSRPSPEVELVIENIRALGTDVRVTVGDVANERDVATLLGEIAATLPPLRGVVHAAGVLADGTLLRLDAERFDRVLAPKVLGAWNLHALTRHLPLDFFVLFSSLASVTGSPGQANYAAANAFLDALAEHRRQSGLPGVSVNWAAWAEGGMASNRLESSVRRGLHPLTPQQALDVLDVCLVSRGQVCVVPADWPRFLEQVPHEQAATFFADVGTARGRESDERARDFRQRVREATGAAREELVASYVGERVAAVLGLPPDAALDPHAGFFDLGMDSLMATELRNQLQRGLEMRLPATIALEHGTVAALAAHLASLIAPPVAPDAPAVASSDEHLGSLLAEVEGLSEDEIDRALLAWTGKPQRGLPQ